MPDEAQMKAALQSYLDGFNASDLGAILGLFADDAIVEDPVGTPPIQGEQLREFYRRGVSMGTRLTLDTPIRGSHGNCAAMAFTVETVVEGTPVTVRSVDVMTFNDAGKISHMRAYWAPGDYTTAAPKP
jgi:steroid delta-isomerase